MAPPLPFELAFAMLEGLSRSQVEAVAALATLELSEAELELFARQLAEILNYAVQVQKIDTTGVAPTSSVLTPRVSERDDVVQPSLDRADALSNAPDASLEAGLFRVPRVIG
jgi:aspartyl-tRNA(Asn)/glutamyl-tRNA(Gln) amidotransferase subunit C